MKGMVSFILFCSCAMFCEPSVASSAKRDLPQCGSANARSNPCPVSIYELLANSGYYDGKYVKFIAFYPSSSARVVYANEDAALHLDFSSSILLDKVPGELCGYRSVSGLFVDDARDSGVSPNYYRQAGKLSEVQFFFPLRPIGRKCSTDNGRVYVDGIFPAPNE